MKRPCLGLNGTCPILVDSPACRCAVHQKAATRIATRRRDSTAERGYDAKWRRISAAVIRRDGGECQLRLAGCAGKATTADHIVPLARGGDRLDMDNLQAACRPCNSKKGAR